MLAANAFSEIFFQQKSISHEYNYQKKFVGEQTWFKGAVIFDYTPCCCIFQRFNTFTSLPLIANTAILKCVTLQVYIIQTIA